MEARENRRVRQTKSLLKESLKELMLAKPIEQITIKEICENADVNRSTFYNYYADQYALLNSVEDDILSEVRVIFSEAAFHADYEQLVGGITRILNYVTHDGAFCQLLLSEKGDTRFQRELLGSAQQSFVNQWVQSQNQTPEMAEYLYVFVVMGSIGLIQNWMKTGMKKSPEEMARLVVELTNRSMKSSG